MNQFVPIVSPALPALVAAAAAERASMRFLESSQLEEPR
jgi:hypothetical protein